MIIFAGAVLLYFAISKIVYKQIDTSLLTEKEIIKDQIEQTGTIPDFEASFGHQIEVRIYDKSVRPFQILKDTILTDTLKNIVLPFRYLYFSGNASANNGYSIRLWHTLQEKNDLLEDIALYMFFLFSGLFIISILMNYLISKRLWKPFYVAVNKAEQYDIQSQMSIELPESNIKEFKQLNAVLRRMTAKMRADYLSLKEFNENAAHEIQTPLAIIRSKLELLMQKEVHKKESLAIIKSIDEATTKLYKLNQGLLLISKIDNLYFKDEKEVSLKNIIENNISNYKEIMQLKRINVEIIADDPALVRISELLAEVMISNLISNAVRYNVDGGYIKCKIEKGTISISNSGMTLKTDPQNLFRRFHKEGDNPQSVGLGLSIVHKIAEEYKMDISYIYHDHIHELRLTY